MGGFGRLRPGGPSAGRRRTSYWIIDPEAKLLEMFELGPERRYVAALSATQGQVCVPGYQDLVLVLDELWAEVDQVIGEEGEGEAPAESGEG